MSLVLVRVIDKMGIIHLAATGSSATMGETACGKWYETIITIKVDPEFDGLIQIMQALDTSDPRQVTCLGCIAADDGLEDRALAIGW